MRPAAAESTGLPTGTFNLHLKNGRQRLVVIRTVQLRDDANAVEGVVATIKDITDESRPVARRIIAESQAMRDLLDFVRRIADSEATDARAQKRSLFEMADKGTLFLDEIGETGGWRAPGPQSGHSHRRGHQ